MSRFASAIRASASLARPPPREPGAQPRQPDPLLPQLLLDAGELGALVVEVGLDRHLLGLQHGDVALQGADALAVAREGAGEAAFAPLLGLHQPLLPVHLRADRG